MGRAPSCAETHFQRRRVHSPLLLISRHTPPPSLPSYLPLPFRLILQWLQSPNQFGIDFSVELLFGRMSSGATDPRMDEDNDSVEDEMDGLVSCANKNKRRKAPRRNLKAEREKLKREQLNELFSKLASALEQNEETYGKACIVREAIKFVNDLLSDIQALRKDNADLLSESQYLMAEKNELRDENCTLETQIKNIQNYIAASNDSQVHPIAAKVADPPSIVSKPHARYPTSTDSWTLQLLQK